MDYPLAAAGSDGSERSFKRNAEREENRILTPLADYALYGENWADSPSGSNFLHPAQREDTSGSPSYDTRLKHMLDDDDDDIGQRRDDFRYPDDTQELVEIRPGSRNNDSDYFGDSMGFRTPGHDEFGEFQEGFSTPVRFYLL
jgi:hypothetical protein